MEKFHEERKWFYDELMGKLAQADRLGQKLQKDPSIIGEFRSIFIQTLISSSTLLKLFRPILVDVTSIESFFNQKPESYKSVLERNLPHSQLFFEFQKPFNIVYPLTLEQFLVPAIALTKHSKRSQSLEESLLFSKVKEENKYLAKYLKVAEKNFHDTFIEQSGGYTVSIFCVKNGFFKPFRFELQEEILGELIALTTHGHGYYTIQVGENSISEIREAEITLRGFERRNTVPLDYTMNTDAFRQIPNFVCNIINFINDSKAILTKKARISEYLTVKESGKRRKVKKECSYFHLTMEETEIEEWFSKNVTTIPHSQQDQNKRTSPLFVVQYTPEGLPVIPANLIPTNSEEMGHYFMEIWRQNVKEIEREEEHYLGFFHTLLEAGSKSQDRSYINVALTGILSTYDLLKKVDKERMTATKVLKSDIDSLAKYLSTIPPAQRSGLRRKFDLNMKAYNKELFRFREDFMNVILRPVMPKSENMELFPWLHSLGYKLLGDKVAKFREKKKILYTPEGLPKVRVDTLEGLIKEIDNLENAAVIVFDLPTTDSLFFEYTAGLVEKVIGFEGEEYKYAAKIGIFTMYELLRREDPNKIKPLKEESIRFQFDSRNTDEVMNNLGKGDRKKLHELEGELQLMVASENEQVEKYREYFEEAMLPPPLVDHRPFSFVYWESYDLLRINALSKII